MRRALVALGVTAGAFGAALPSCSSSDKKPQTEFLSVSELLKPETCKECHPAHYREWSGSMHAYAAQDPVFRAMNARGQRETKGELGDFCVKCHAPLAVELGATTDGLNLDELPDELKGVTCYFCHNVESVEGDHNNPLVLAMDDVMRGNIRDPSGQQGHRSAYSSLIDSDAEASSAMCGACHDIVVPSPPGAGNVHLERTFSEWQTSLFSKAPEEGGLSCGACHLNGRNDVAADVEGVKLRRVHDHSFPGVDLALDPFPLREEQRALVEQELDSTLRTEICVAQLVDGAVLEVTIENLAAGHRWPSGAAHDRRAWVEVKAYAGNDLLYQSGNVEPGQPVADLDDPDLWQFRDYVFKTDASPAHMFWDVASVEVETIPEPLTFVKSDPDFFITHVKRRYPQSTSSPAVIVGVPDRVTVTTHIRPMGLDVLDDLVESGDLSDDIRGAMPTLSLLPDRGRQDVSLEWTPTAAEDERLGSKRELAGVLATCLTNAPQR